jgi:predicted porin
VERIRLKGDFKMQDGLKGYVFNEFFFQLNQSYRDHFKLNRFGFGMEYKIHKDLSVSLGYFRQSTKGYQTPEIFNGLNLEFEIDF